MSQPSHPLLPPWSSVREALARYDEERLREALRALLARSLPTFDALHAALREALGCWYDGSYAWRVGNESFGGCLCHSPVRRLAGAVDGQPQSTPEEALEWVVLEVRALRDALRSFEALFATVPRGLEGEAQRRSLEAATNALIDDLVERTGCSESWYRYVGDGLRWLGDHLGAPRSALEPSLDGALSTLFTSWSAPSVPKRNAAVETLVASLGADAAPLGKDASALVGGLLRPSRPRLPEALDATAKRSGAAALEAAIARGLLEVRWSGEPARGFREFTPKARLGGVTSLPEDATLVAALAADPAGVATAEEHAWEFARALEPWGGPSVERLCWVRARSVEGFAYRKLLPVHPHLAPLATCASVLSGALLPQEEVTLWAEPLRSCAPHDADLLALREQCLAAASEVHRAVLHVRARLGYEFDTVATLWCAERYWSLLAASQLRVPSRELCAALRVPPAETELLLRSAPEGARWSEVPNPLAALLSLWRGGYALHALEPQARTLTLLAPALER